MSKIPLPAAVTVPDYATVRLAWLSRYAEIRGEQLADLNDNDPIVQALEAGAYFEMNAISRNNDSARQTMLASAWGQGLDNLGADPLYGGTARLVTDPGDEDAVPPIPPTYETDDAYRPRLRLAPAALSVAGPWGAYEALALSAHGDVLDARVTSPAPCEVRVEVLIDPDTEAEHATILAAVEGALNDANKRPIGDRVTVVEAATEETSVEITVYVKDGPALDAVQAASQERVRQIVYAQAAKVGSGAAFLEASDGVEGADPNAFLGACVVDGVTSWLVTDNTGMSDDAAAWWPMTINVTAVRTNAP